MKFCLHSAPEILGAWCYCPTLYGSFGAASVSPSLVGLPLQLIQNPTALRNHVLRNPTNQRNCKTLQNKELQSTNPYNLTKPTKWGATKPWLALSCPRMSPLLCSLYGTTRLPHTFKRLRYNTQNSCVPVKLHVLVPSATEVPLTLTVILQDPSPKPTQLADVPSARVVCREMSNGVRVSVGADPCILLLPSKESPLNPWALCQL